MLVYHGSTSRVDMPLADVCRSNLDFGRGFYVTGLRPQAIKWALRAVNTGKPHWLNTYELDIDAVRSVRYRYLRFETYNEAWFDFVVACRRGYDIWQQYDVIEGGIADCTCLCPVPCTCFIPVKLTSVWQRAWAIWPA